MFIFYTERKAQHRTHPFWPIGLIGAFDLSDATRPTLQKPDYWGIYPVTRYVPHPQNTACRGGWLVNRNPPNEQNLTPGTRCLSPGRCLASTTCMEHPMPARAERCWLTSPLNLNQPDPAPLHPCEVVLTVPRLDRTQRPVYTHPIKGMG